MTPALQVALSPQAERIVANFPKLPAQILGAIVRGMDQANQIALNNIKSNHLTGQGPFPPEEHKLGRRSGLLRGSANASASRPISGTQVQSTIGSNVIYAFIHEFGGRIHYEARAMKVRHKLDARGNLVKQLANDHLLVFARAGAKRARTQTVQAQAHDVSMPERAPFRTGLAESRGQYTTNISRQIVAEWQKISS
jgi:phage gpG-like protein